LEQPHIDKGSLSIIQLVFQSIKGNIDGHDGQELQPIQV
jgi:hypothetical protein